MRDFDGDAQHNPLHPGGPGGPGAGDGDAHALVKFAVSVEAQCDGVAQTPAWSMSPAEQADTLVSLDRLESRIEQIRLRVLASAQVNEVGQDQGATSTGAWLANATRQTRNACFASVHLAEALEGDFTETGRALAEGRVNPAQARVIVEAVRMLTTEHDDLPSDVHIRAEAHLLELAESFDATTLRRLGKRLFEVVCPEAADAAEGERLAREEERARRLASFRLRDNGDGTSEGWFRLPTVHAEALKKALQALTAPRRIGPGRFDPETGKKLDQATVLGHGLIDLIEHHLDVGSMPSSQGSPFTVLVTMGIDALMSGLGAATTETGSRISAGEARRLACQAGIIPIVLGGDSVPLDLGRERRFFSKYQRIALAHRHGGCAAVNCDRPPAWVEAHHKHPWSQGGKTDLADGIPLCPPHHHMADHPDAWNMRTMPSGGVRFSRRQ